MTTDNSCEVLTNFLHSRSAWNIVWSSGSRTNERISRRQYESVSLSHLCCDLRELREEWLTLRVLAILTNGCVHVLNKQVIYLAGDLKQLVAKMKKLDHVVTVVNSTKRRQSITLKDPLLSVKSFTDSFSLSNILVPGECDDYIAPPCESTIVADIHDITISEDHSSRIIEVPADDDFDGNESIFGDWMPLIDGTPRPVLRPTTDDDQHKVTPTHPTINVGPQLKPFISPMMDIELPPLDVQPTRRNAKRKLKFDVITQLKENKIQKPNAFARSSNSCSKKTSPKEQFTIPTSSIIHEVSQLFKLWKANLWANPMTSIAIDDIGEVEVLREGSNYDGSAWTNATPLYDDSSAMVNNRSNEFDFIMTNVKRTLDGVVGGAHLSPISDREDDELEDYNNEFLGDISEMDSDTYYDNWEPVTLKIRRDLGHHDQTEFSSLLSKDVTKMKAASSFSTVLGLLQTGIISAAQDRPYGPIVLTRGEHY